MLNQPTTEDSDQAEDGAREEVARSARQRHKQFARDRRANAVHAHHRRDRLASKEPTNHVDMTKKSMNLWELRDMLKGCSGTLQAQVSKSKLVHAIKAALGMKSVSALRAAVFGSNSLVTKSSDV